jgi:hypothetical protein
LYLVSTRKKIRRAAQLALSGWFAIAMTMAQACAPAAQAGGTAGYASPTASASTGGNGGTSASYAAAHSGASAAPIDTRGYTANQGESRALTDYLKQHRLPLVGGQVLEQPKTGARVVVLYGFVATDFGKNDARQKAQSFIGDDSVAVDNRITVNPDLLTAGRSAGSPDAQAQADQNAQAQADKEAQQAQAANSMPGVQSYIDQQNQAAAAQQYQQQNQIGGMSTVVPLIALLAILGSVSSSSSSFSFGGSPGYGGYGASPFGGSPYGMSPYSPYAGYPTAPGYGGSPYGPGAPSPFTPFP